MKKTKLLIVDDDPDFLHDFILLLQHDYDCITAKNLTETLRQLIRQNPDAVLLDLMLGKENGLEVLDKILSTDRTIPVIMITDYASVETAVTAIRKGAFDYITKSPDIQKLKFLIEKSFHQRRLHLQKEHLQEQSELPFHRMIGDSEAMAEVEEKILLYSKHPAHILVTGESGVGKELVARQIYRLSSKKQAPFVAVNCAAIPRELAESELFGHEKGAYTGAEARQIGKFELAGDGIIFMDEISELSLDVQVKLLRVLQEREFTRTGGSATIKTHAKVIAATNKNLEACVKEGSFREDLYYRLDVLPIHVPPLRERREDIPLLVNHFIEQECQDMKIPVKSCPREVMAMLMNYSWPGNIRQLRNFITRAVILCTGPELLPEHFDPILRSKNPVKETSGQAIPRTWHELNSMRKKAADEAGRNVEKAFIDHLLLRHEGNVSRAAKAIGIHRTNLHKIIRRVEAESTDGRVESESGDERLDAESTDGRGEAGYSDGRVEAGSIGRTDENRTLRRGY